MTNRAYLNGVSPCARCACTTKEFGNDKICNRPDFHPHNRSHRTNEGAFDGIQEFALFACDKRDWMHSWANCTYHTLFLFAIRFNLQWIDWMRRKTLLLSNELWQEITFGHSRIQGGENWIWSLKVLRLLLYNQSIMLVFICSWLIGIFSVAINRTVYCFIGLFDLFIILLCQW